MLAIPEINALDLAFGKIDHMPKYDTLSEDIKSYHNEHQQFVSGWFFNGLKIKKEDNIIFNKNGVRYKAREGVDLDKAVMAMQAVLGSFEPKHEHKMAGVAYMLNEWFERQS